MSHKKKSVPLQSSISVQEPGKRPNLKALPPASKYKPYLERFDVELPDRRWPDRTMSAAPTWCSVDLRDGNQALVNPLSLEQKLRFYHYLVAMNFKEIEISFPAASAVEFDFTRLLIEQKLVPEDVNPQVITQARDQLIDKTFEAIVGARQAIVHLYNSTSEVQRRVVFKLPDNEIIRIAVNGTKRVLKRARECDTQVTLQYSPESFTGTELWFARDICRAVIDVWEPSAERPLIINLPATVEVSTPNVHADQIEWMIRQFEDITEHLTFSVHTHNDRGTGVASAELALLAGATRVEGTLFGNGERTGNVDLITMALNLYAQGVDPELHLGDLQAIQQLACEMTELPIHPRHPYAGELVFTAFSCSHQDAVSKGLLALKTGASHEWEVPYLSIDPADIGRTFESLVRINSQSGKGGIAYVLESSFGYSLPKKMHPEVSAAVQFATEQSGKELSLEDVFRIFEEVFLDPANAQLSL
ncbi:MAG: 2-isopropylmalate synthase, partial [Bdellovibrionales bacterium]|nr:2-isopropylmalate synthase [Bdellovibrionales bacterium]